MLLVVMPPVLPVPVLLRVPVLAVVLLLLLTVRRLWPSKAAFLGMEDEEFSPMGRRMSCEPANEQVQVTLVVVVLLVLLVLLLLVVAVLLLLLVLLPLLLPPLPLLTNEHVQKQTEFYRPSGDPRTPFGEKT